MAITWTKITDGLPDYGEKVMLTRNVSNQAEVTMGMRLRTDNLGEHYSSEFKGVEFQDVIAWAEIPVGEPIPAP